MGCSPLGREESDMTERLPFHFSLSCIGEGNGNPLQYSCLENPRDGGAWWAAVYGVAHDLSDLAAAAEANTSFLYFTLSSQRITRGKLPRNMSSCTKRKKKKKIHRTHEEASQNIPETQQTTSSRIRPIKSTENGIIRYRL